MQPHASPSPPIPERTAHPFLTYEMIHEIPAAMRETLRKASVPAAATGRALADRSALYFTGCGTAYFSALLAQRLVAAAEKASHRSNAVPAAELSNYHPALDRSSGVVGVSHSGITKATVDAMRSARDRGSKTVGITHFGDRPIAEVSDATLMVGNGPDRSRCHTKCYVAGALGAAMVGLEWAAASGGPRRLVDERLDELRALPELQSKVLASVEPSCKDLAETHLGRKNTFIVGFGPNEPTALETALKLIETSFIAAQGLETEQFLHGPAQALDADGVVLVSAPPGPGRARTLDLLRAVRTVGAHSVSIAMEGDREVEALSEATLFVPPVDEYLSPFMNIIPLYLYAYFASVRQGHNPDVLRYLEPGYWDARNIVFPPGTH